MFLYLFNKLFVFTVKLYCIKITSLSDLIVSVKEWALLRLCLHEDESKTTRICHCRPHMIGIRRFRSYSLRPEFSNISVLGRTRVAEPPPKRIRFPDIRSRGGRSQYLRPQSTTLLLVHAAISPWWIIDATTMFSAEPELAPAGRRYAVSLYKPVGLSHTHTQFQKEVNNCRLISIAK